MTIYMSPFARSARRQMMDDFLRNAGYPEMMENDVHFPVDVKAEADRYVLSALIPGVKPEDLNVQIVNETVTIQGEFKQERQDSDTYLLREIPDGRFSRVLTLPSQVDSTRVEAHLENGVLTLSIPKAEAARPKTIKITTK